MTAFSDFIQLVAIFFERLIALFSILSKALERALSWL